MQAHLESHGGGRDARLRHPAGSAGLSVAGVYAAAFLRRAARADETIREHCRLRGLLKHHFASIRAAGKTEELEQMYNTDSEFSVKRIIKSCLIPQPRGIILQD